MKRAYIAPDIQVERYELNTSIAAQCKTDVTMGPEVGSHTACKEFEDIWGGEFAINTFVLEGSFYDDGTCTCYYSSSGEGYFAS